DLEQNQELVRAYLTLLGRDADFVGDGEQAVAAVQTRAYSLVLMDVRMPRMDGIAATQAIRALQGPARNIPIIAMTANVWPEQIRAIEAAGMNGHVAKPVELDAFRRALARFPQRPDSEGAPGAPSSLPRGLAD